MGGFSVTIRRQAQGVSDISAQCFIADITQLQATLVIALNSNKFDIKNLLPEGTAIFQMLLVLQQRSSKRLSVVWIKSNKNGFIELMHGVPCVAAV